MKHMYLVMDSRAQFDFDKATILECCGNKKPSWRSLGQDWGNQGAVLVRCHRRKFNGAVVYADGEVVGVIK